MRIAVVADTHGNTWALDAVLNDIARRDVEFVVNLGDSADIDMDPEGTLDLLMSADIPSIAGNYETYRDGQLSGPQVSWLSSLPKTLELEGVFCCHGTPTSDNHELIEQIDERGVRIASDSVILERLGGVKHSLVLCAHKHVPRAVRLSTGQLIVNPGSVGLPAYAHDEPVEHVVEAGSPHSRYAIVSQAADKWAVEHLAIDYPWDKAAALARSQGREDRAEWIASGRASCRGR